MFGTERGTQWGYSLWELEVYQSGTTNIALNRPATSSSTENAVTYAPSKAVDGSTGTRWASGSPDANTGPLPPATNDPNSGSSGWHIYGVDWYADHIDFSVDENVYHRHYFNDGGAFAVDGADSKEVRLVNGVRVTYSEYSNHFSEWHPFEHKFFLILSAGVGGSCTYGGAIVPEAQFPCSTFIDWVRVYTMDGAAARSITGNTQEVDATGFQVERLRSYPSPAREVLNVPGTKDGTPGTIVDLSGRVVRGCIVEDQSVNVASLQSGFYVLRLRQGNRLLITKFIKE